MEGMTLEAWVAVLAVLCVGLALGMVSTTVYAWQQWAALRGEQVSREVERIALGREVEVLRQAVEQEHGKSPARTVSVMLPGSSSPEAAARDIAGVALEGEVR